MLRAQKPRSHQLNAGVAVPRGGQVPGIALVFTLAACAAPQTTLEDYRPPVAPSEEEAMAAAGLRMPQAASGSLETALKRYQANDDLYGQWRVTLMLARLQLAQGQQSAAADSIERLHDLGRQLDQPEFLFQSAILMGRSGGGEAYFQRALEQAGNPLERALALTYLSDYEKAAAIIEPEAIDRPADRAFVHFRYAVSRQSPAAMERALAYYRMAMDPRGIADSLVYLARWASAAGDNVQAHDYAERARRALAASGDEQRAAAVAKWLESLP